MKYFMREKKKKSFLKITKNEGKTFSLEKN